MGKHSGGCLCGAVRFEIEGDFDAFFLCHCGRCRKDTGSSNAANLFASGAALTWLQGRDQTNLYQVADTRHAKCFCKTCGSAVPIEHEAAGLIVVPAGALETDIPIRPTAHICMSSRANWDDTLEELPKMDGMPG
ncbi:GFA family protein [Sneathiella limimaris]|uniref:GFA family protein n=1 Tax=Sneathiella limimaris TaxID=1964213 RepID=UPI00146A8EBA|nr:GFA family protein [Sneathiella limimaris]